MTSKLAVAAAGLGHGYRPGQWLFRAVTFELPAGSALAILGPNGRGKSTLLRCLAGITTPREGTSTVASPLAFVPASAQIEFSYSAFQMVLMGRARAVGLFSQPSAGDETIAHRAMQRLDIQHLGAQPWDTLSGGERQLTLMARALASEARTLFLDEPTASLDPHNQVRVVHRLRTLVRDEGLSLVFTTHDPNQAHAVATHALLMFDGAQHRMGASADLLDEQSLSELFSCDIRRIHSGSGDGSPPYFVTAYMA